jgi:CubicO group peptidase (beta-lactamase class C family)
MFWLIVLVFVFSPSLSTADEIDDYITNQMERAHIPSLVGMVVQGEEILWSHTYGSSYDSTPPPLSQAYMLASISKTVMSVTLMQLYEQVIFFSLKFLHSYFSLLQGLFALDDDINKYLNFSVRNPHYPDLPITFEQLMAHSSSINDDGYFNNDILFYVQGDSPYPLGFVSVKLRNILSSY